MAAPAPPPPDVRPLVGDITPAPPPEVVGAIVAAVDAAWPRPVVVVPVERRASGSAWRFSGRWWSRPIIQRRERPW